MRGLIFFYCLCFVLISCDKNKNPYENKLGIEPSLIAEMDTAHYTFIQWKDTVSNFGTIENGDSVHFKFEFKNVGNTPLFILDTRTTCGCTVTDFPKDPVMPGKSGFIISTFKSGTQTGEINKNITVVANTKNTRYSNLTIQGTVKPADKKQ